MTYRSAGTTPPTTLLPAYVLGAKAREIRPTAFWFIPVAAAKSASSKRGLPISRLPPTCGCCGAWRSGSRRRSGWASR